MSGAIATAVVASAVIGAGASLYQADQQQKIAKDDAARREQEAARLKSEQERIAADTRPDGQAASEIQFGVDRSNDVIGSANDFLVPRTSQLGTSNSGRSGLGFKV